MRILIINSVCGIRSTGRIATESAKAYMAQGHECRIAFGREEVPQQYAAYAYRIGSRWDVRRNALKVRLFDNEAFNARRETQKFLEWADQYDPDLLCLHNLHGYYINVELLFNWIKKRPHMKVEWTLHDCWAFTGHCAHFSFVGCDRWKEGCHHCPQTGRYPAALLTDSSETNYRRKKAAFCGVPNMTLITPSKWLADLVQASFLKEYPVRIAYNTINTDVFKLTPGDFARRYGLQGQKIVLGVASAWDDRKGLQDFVKLCTMLDDSFRIVLVGLSKKQMKKMPKRMICIPATNSAEELAQIYTAADIFLNLSREETFGLTTVEALSCGTFPVVYKGTACEEIVARYGGMAVEQDLQAVVNAVCQVTAGSPAIQK